MKYFIASILVKILRKLKVSVIIGHKFDNTQAKFNTSFIYDNCISGVVKDSDGFDTKIIDGYFKYKRKKETK